MSVASFAKSPKISAPGFSKYNKEFVSQKEKSQDQHHAIKPVVFANAPQRYVMMAEETETKGIRLLKTYEKEIEKYNDNYERISEDEYTYDKYGFFHKRQNLKLDEYSLVEYKWFVSGWKWSEKVDTWYYKTGGTVYDRTSAIKRTFYANGSVRSSRNYDNGNLENEQIFDENGNLIEIIEGDSKKTYTYFPYLDEWLESTYSPYEINECTVYDNYFKLTNTVLINDKWMPRMVHEYYYDKKKQQCGNLDIYYNDEGKVSNAYGYKNIVIEENANEIISGYFNFDQETMEWKESSRVIQSPNYDNPWIYKEGETRFYKYYYRYSSEEELKLQYEDKYSWVKDDLVKDVATEYNDEGKSYTYNTYYFVEDKELSHDIYYDEKTGNYALDDYVEIDGKEYDIYSYFDANGNLLSKIRVSELVWEQWDGSKWIPCIGEVTVYEGSDYYVAKFNDKGQLISLTEYEDGLFESREDYVYIPNGFERNTWEYKEGTTELYLYEFYTYTLANNVETVTKFEYDEDGT
ncbi:MAG: hypothetical protein K2J74_00910, partial [Muribaculaceae bacterium]|nr:hypothetical protein [Muribaculaceae bacterium]